MSTQLSLGEAAEILNVSEKSVRRYIKSGRIKATLVKGQKGYEYRMERDQLKIFSKPPRGKNSHKESERKVVKKNVAKYSAPFKDTAPQNVMPRASEIAQKSQEKILYMAEKEKDLVDYKLLYERLLAKYEHALIMIGSLETQNKNHIIPKGSENVSKLEGDLARQEEMIMELYQELRLYKERGNIEY